MNYTWNAVVADNYRPLWRSSLFFCHFPIPMAKTYHFHEFRALLYFSLIPHHSPSALLSLRHFCFSDCGCQDQVKTAGVMFVYISYVCMYILDAKNYIKSASIDRTFSDGITIIYHLPFSHRPSLVAMAMAFTIGLKLER